MNQLLEKDKSFPAWLTLSWAWEQSLEDPAAVKAALARNLRSYREGRSLSQKELAKAAGTTLTRIRDIEAGQVLPPIELMVHLGDSLGISCGALVDCGVSMTTASCRRIPAGTPTREARAALA